MADIQLRLDKDVLVIEGAMGTMLQQMEISSEESGLLLNVLDPELITDIHRRYKAAGANCAVTNTFGGTKAKLQTYGLAERAEELNRAGVRAAKDADVQHVLADVGPCGLTMYPLGTASFEDVYQQFFEQISFLAAEGPDAILIETMADIAEARCAVLAGKAACNLPIFVSCTFNEYGRMDLSGTDPATAALILEGVGADAVGMNCGLGPEQMLPLFAQMAQATALPLLVQPNAGIPYLDAKGITVFPGTADEMAAAAWEFRRLGAQVIGSCCGTNPVFTAAIYAAVGDTDVVLRQPPLSVGRMVLASPNKNVAIGPGLPTRILGERINPTGKPELAAELEQGSMSLVRRFAEQQEQAGADLLDLNVGAPLVDAKIALPAAAQALVGFTSCPLVFDTTDPVALEAALRIYPGRALINSVNGDPESYELVFPLAKEYGAGIIVLALDKSGVPSDVEGRMAIIERVRQAANEHGLQDHDLLCDLLTMTAATNPQAPETTLLAVEQATSAGLATVLGISNVSHGLPERPMLNAAFASAAVAAGLSAAIVNPNDATMISTIRAQSDSSEHLSLESGLETWRLAFARAMQKAAAGTEKLAEARSSATSDDSVQQDVPEKGASVIPEVVEAEKNLKGAVLRGDADAAPGCIDAIVASGVDAATITDNLLAPTLKELGTAFERGEAFLPQMMVAAEAMKAAVARIKHYLPIANADDFSGKVVFCSVKGDVHSIGKDICIALLESQGFKVFDLGVDVEPAAILDAARENDADVVCLSALMTTTLGAMQQTVNLIYSEEPRYRDDPGRAVLVGGAVVTKRWADIIGVGYAADAPSCVEIIREVCRSKA